MPVFEAIFSNPRSSAFIGGHTVLLGSFGWLDHRITKMTKNIWPPINADERG
jgi:hypothetical protein